MAAMAFMGRPRAVDAKAISLPRADLRQIAVPAERGVLGEIDARLARARAVAVEQAELDTRRGLREERKIGAEPVPRRAERIGLAGPDLHCRLNSASSKPESDHSTRSTGLH